MDKRIVNTYVKKMANEDIDKLVNAFHLALNGKPDLSKSIIIRVLLEEPK
jgi:hypothetical protein